MNYTDKELMQAWENGPSITDTATMLSRFRAFLSALPNKQNDVQEERDELNKDLSALLRVLDAHDVTEGVIKVREMMRRLQAAEHINEGYRSMEAANALLQEELVKATALAVRRMKAVPLEELGLIVWDVRMVQGLSAIATAKAILIRLIDAVEAKKAK